MKAWSRVVRLIEAHPDVKQVRLNRNEHSVSVGFYETPSEETLNQIKNDVRAALAGQWDVSITPDDTSPMIHLHKIDGDTTEFHRAHPSNEPPVVWKRIPVPTWRNRPFPRPVPRDYRVMLGRNCELQRIFCLSHFGFGEDSKACLRRLRAGLVTDSLATCGNDGTTSTGQPARRTVPSATLPSNACRNPVRPCVEMIIKSALCFAAAS